MVILRPLGNDIVARSAGRVWAMRKRIRGFDPVDGREAAAMQAVAMGGFLLVFMLSGLIFPIQNIPAGIRWLSNFIWGRYYIDIVRDALLQGGGWPAVWWKVIVIGFTGSVFYTIAWRNMRRMQLKA